MCDLMNFSHKKQVLVHVKYSEYVACIACTEMTASNVIQKSTITKDHSFLWKNCWEFCVAYRSVVHHSKSLLIPQYIC